ncbi:N-acetyllactosaminide beta-1,3-N-acetylglucosaminyltransferase 2 isoform X1 [Arapaima gigas]
MIAGGNKDARAERLAAGGTGVANYPPSGWKCHTLPLDQGAGCDGEDGVRSWCEGQEENTGHRSLTQEARSRAMQCGKKFRILSLMVTLNLLLFIMLEVSRYGGQRKKQPEITTKRFWKSLVPSSAYWNREQQKLDFLHNPILKMKNDSVAVQAAWLHNRAQQESCKQDKRVHTQVKDYNTLPARFKDFLLYMRCRTYPMVVDQPQVCKDKPFLLLAIKSLAPHFDRRQAIRQTWGRAGQMANRTIATVFLLGNATSLDHFPNLWHLIQQESSVHKDLLIWDYRDTFFNLTIKDVLFQEWIGLRCPEVSFIFKGDDDVFVNTYQVLDFLNGLTPAQAKNLFVGDLITNAGPHRDKKVKYFIPESVFVGVYPPYAGGGGYLYSGDLALRLRAVSHKVTLYPIDDVYTGMCLRKLGLTPEKHKGFRTFDIQERYRENVCVYRSLILVHSRTPQQIIQIWSWISNMALRCT